ncbi:MAG: acetyl-CoA carboxylase biotin carboxyl carrier protein subunit [Candidatus Aminicenantes bacterium]|nr:acetyl-CoA carboxylase biotin carboxyl carrier protein subunit [Candidatus Aminicenantes bacterium]
MEYEFLIDGDKEKIAVEPGKGAIKVIGPEGALELDARRISDNCLSLLHDGRSHQVFHARDKERLLLWVDGEAFEVREPSEDEGGRRAEEGVRQGLWRIASPMPGKVIKVVVAEGDKVRKNQTLAVVEAMKMENELKAPGDGTVKKVHASAGDLVDTNNPILEVEAG